MGSFKCEFVNGCNTPRLPAASALPLQAAALNRHAWLGKLPRQLRLQKDIITAPSQTEFIGSGYI